jgi:hypothetical protein
MNTLKSFLTLDLYNNRWSLIATVVSLPLLDLTFKSFNKNEIEFNFLKPLFSKLKLIISNSKK